MYNVMLVIHPGLSSGLTWGTICLQFFYNINPQCACAGRVTVLIWSVYLYLSVLLSVCPSVIMKSATYIDYTSKTRYHGVLRGVFLVFVMWLLLKCFLREWHHLLVTAAQFMYYSASLYIILYHNNYYYHAHYGCGQKHDCAFPNH